MHHSISSLMVGLCRTRSDVSRRPSDPHRGKLAFSGTSWDLLGQVLAESEGFEPPSPRGLTVFKTAAFNRSANSPLPSEAGILRAWKSACKIDHGRARQRKDAPREDLWPPGLGRGVPVARFPAALRCSLRVDPARKRRAGAPAGLRIPGRHPHGVADDP